MSTNTEHDFEPIADVSAQRVAKVYAEALLNAADKQGQADEVIEELAAIVHDVFKAEPDFETFLSSGALGRERKEGVLRSVLAGRASDVFLDFLLVLNRHDRLDLLRPILAASRDIRDERARRMHVRVRSAVELPDDQRARLVQQLQASFHKEPILQVQVDPALIGGMVLRIDDWVYDASVRTQLETLRNQLMERSSYEIQSRRDRFSSADGN